jgi:hypothetical protein
MTSKIREDMIVSAFFNHQSPNLAKEMGKIRSKKDSTA